jgi:hypothetical protein
MSTRALAFAPFEWESVPDNALAMYLDLYRTHRHLIAMEVHNGTRPLSEYPLDRNLWDRLLSELMPGRPVWGTATDDMHSMRHFAGDWVEFPMAGNSAEEVRQAMLDGAFYFASTSIHGGSEPSVERTPVLTSVRVVAVHEDMDKLGRKDRSRLTNAGDKRFTSLEEFKQNAEAYLERKALHECLF